MVTATVGFETIFGKFQWSVILVFRDILMETAEIIKNKSRNSWNLMELPGMVDSFA